MDIDTGAYAPPSGLSADDESDWRTERAAILEYCAGFSRPEAERRAGITSAEAIASQQGGV